MKPNSIPPLVARRLNLLAAGFRENTKGELVKWVSDAKSCVCLYPYKHAFLRDHTGKVLGPARTLLWDEEGQPMLSTGERQRPPRPHPVQRPREATVLADMR